MPVIFNYLLLALFSVILTLIGMAGIVVPLALLVLHCLGVVFLDIPLLTILGLWFLMPLFIRAGRYPGWLSFFQTPDAPAWGTDEFQSQQMAWARGIPTASYLHLCAVVWQLRNPAQGFDQYCRADIDLMDMVKSYGDTRIRAGCIKAADGFDQAGYGGWFLITHRNGYFHFRAIVPLGTICFSPEFGWRLHGMVDGHPSEICKQMVFTPIRFIKFVKSS